MIRIIPFSVLLVLATPAPGAIRVLPTGSAPTGFSPAITIEGLAPGAVARVHAYATYEKWQEDADGRWTPRAATYHAWADIRADRRGKVAMDRYKVTRGTYAGVDGYGLLWSMRKPGDPILEGGVPTDAPSPKAGQIMMLVTQDGRLIGESSFRLGEPSGLTVMPVAQGRLHGSFAFPTGRNRLPTLILLHGSEGGGTDEARAMATRYAGQGYAAFALNYFAWDLKALKGPPNYHVNQPIELIGQLRDWLAARPEVDVRRIGLYGHSKGAEYAVIAASYYPWIKAVAACVPSDVIWEGYGIGDPRNRPDPALSWPAQRSSWSWQGKALPYVPLYTSKDRKWFDNTERYSTSRAEHPSEAKASLIPIERSRAKFLLLGGGRDEVWASGEMARKLAERLRRSGRGSQATSKVYPTAGHQICGDGTYPTHIWADPSADPRVKDPTAEGAAAADAWTRIKTFLKRSL